MTLARRIFLGLVLAASLLAVVIALGRWSREQLRDDPRYAVTLDEIDFPVPPGQTRREFLVGLRYIAHNDNRYSTVDPNLGDKLAELFRQHPAVAEVVGTTVTPPRQVHVELRFKSPAGR